MRPLQRLLLLLSLCLALLPALIACEQCAAPYQDCDPDGASLRDVPVPGPDLGRLYLEMLFTVKAQPAPRQPNRPNGPARRDGNGLCCTRGIQCLLTSSFHIAMCWDRFTTNYFLPDGSFGNLANGSYMSSAGGEANLISGDYKLANGMTGNIYDLDPADRPDTSTLPMPTPFTSNGVGTAIPGSALGATATSTPAVPSSVASSGPTSVTPLSMVSMTSSSLMPTAAASATQNITSTFFVTEPTGTGGYGGPYNNASGVSPTMTSTTSSGSSMVSVFTGSPIVPSINMAAASLIWYVVPRILISALAAMVVG